MNRDGTLSYDGSGNLYDENGNLILLTNQGIQGGLQTILGITAEEAVQIMKDAGLKMDSSKTACWDLSDNNGKSIGMKNKTAGGKTYGEIYQNRVITDSLTGMSGTLEQQNPYNIYKNMVNDGTMQKYEGSALGKIWNAVKGNKDSISYEQWKDQNYMMNPSLDKISLQKALENEGIPTSEFGMRKDPFGTGETKFHAGTDYSVTEGTPFHAMADGKISFVGQIQGGGNSVIIEHSMEYGYKDGYATSYYYTDYFHLSSGSVNGVASNYSVGQYVTSNNVVGYTGNSGTSTGPHLHEAVHFTSLSNNPYANWLNQNGYLEKNDKNNWYSNINNFK